MEALNPSSPWRRGPRALGALAAIALLAPLAGAEQLVGHSFTAPPDPHALANDWYMAGTTIPTGGSLVMSPGATGRIGCLWSLTPLLTADFEVTLRFKVTRPPAGTEWARDAGIALWYTYDNGTEILEPLMTEHAHNQAEIIGGIWGVEYFKQGIHTLGFKTRYNGLGVFVQDHDTPEVSAAINDATKDPTIPAPNSVKFETEKEVTIKLRVEATGARLDVPGKGAQDVTGAFKPGGYLGLTSYGGSHSGKPEVSSKFEVLELSVNNFDKESKGEEAHATPPPKPAVPESEKVDVFAEASNFKDLRAESDAIKDLTNMVFKLVVETQPMRLQMSRAIESLGKRITAMEKNFGELKAELDKKTGHKLGAEFEAIKAELTTLSSVANKETEERHQKLQNLHEDIAHVHKTASSGSNIDKHLDKLSDSNNKVLDQLTNEHQKMFGVSIAAIAFIIIAGLSLYNKFRCWEKKHVL